jgi:RNA polymerase sigma-70 factor (ECF subfamily)
VENPQTDEELMDAVRDGNEAAYVALFERHRAALYGYALRMTRQPEVADDVFQETFLRVHRARATWASHQGSFRIWLFRIATNTIRDGARQAARRPEVAGGSWEPHVHAHHGDRIALERALGELPDNLRDAFTLTAVLGMDHNEVAAALDISPDNARARVSRARARLRELLEVS